MRKKILSMSIAAVLTAVTSSGVMAFDTLTTSNTAFDGEIFVQPASPSTTPSVEAGYTGNILPITLATNPNPPAPATAPLALSTNGRGDALIFPVFSQCQSTTDPLCVIDGVASNWSSEVVIRNTSRTNAIVAKVAFYESINSTEVLDFNIYLSADDVTRFTISNGTVTSTDDSIIRLIPSAIGGTGTDDVTRLNFASAEAGKEFTRPLPSNAGYIVVYGMAQATASVGNDNDTRYHTQHDLLFENYRRELDLCRPNWRVGSQNAMLNGTYTQGVPGAAFSIAAPNQGGTSCVTPTSTADLFGDVNPVLTGTIRLESDVPANLARDMMLPAVAINNFTTGNKLLWTEGEIAALQDRRIMGTTRGTGTSGTLGAPGTPGTLGFPGTLGTVGTVGTVGTSGTNSAWASYYEAGIIADASAFLVGTTTYTYKKGSAANQLTVTQPYKRALVQLGNDNGYWSGVGNTAVAATATTPAIPAMPFGGFSFFSKFFDEFEEQSTIIATTSPTTSTPGLRPREVQGLSNFEGLAGYKISGEAFADDNGFALIRFTNSGGATTTATATAAANLAAAANPANPNGPVIVGTPSTPTGATYRIPAIITQMVGSTIGTANTPQLNWIYSQTN